MNPLRASPRVGFALAALACALLLAFGYYLQYVKGLDPCPLCLVQRGCFYGVLAISVLAALHGPRGKGAIGYGVGVFLVAAGGAAGGPRPGLLQHPPADKVAAGGAGLFFLLQKFPPAPTPKRA